MENQKPATTAFKFVPYLVQTLGRYDEDEAVDLIVKDFRDIGPVKCFKKASYSKVETCIKMGSEAEAEISTAYWHLKMRPAPPYAPISHPWPRKCLVSLSFLYRTSFSSHLVFLSFGYLRITGY